MKTAAKFFVCAMLMFGCVATDIDQRADFARYRTFSWGKTVQKVENPLYRGDLIDEQIKTLIREELEKKGMTYRKSGADVLVGYETYTEMQERLAGGRMAPPNPFWPYYWAYGWGTPFGWWYSMPMTESYTEGVMVINVHERRTGRQVWRGSVADAVEGGTSMMKKIQKGVRAIMKKYPAPVDMPEVQKKEKVVS